jgi:hypothetical protein
MHPADDVQKSQVDHSVAPAALRSGERFTWLNSQRKLCAYPAQFWVEINTRFKKSALLQLSLLRSARIHVALQQFWSFTTVYNFSLHQIERPPVT